MHTLLPLPITSTYTALHGTCGPSRVALRLIGLRGPLEDQLGLRRGLPREASGVAGVAGSDQRPEHHYWNTGQRRNTGLLLHCTESGTRIQYSLIVALGRLSVGRPVSVGRQEPVTEAHHDILRLSLAVDEHPHREDHSDGDLRHRPLGMQLRKRRVKHGKKVAT